MRVIGIDQSLTLTALVMLATEPDADGVIQEVSCIDPARWAKRCVPLKGTARLHYIREKVIAFIDGHMPDMVLMEGFAYNAKGSSVFEMGGLGWLLRWTFANMMQPYLIVPPSVVKSFATGKGNAPKEVMLREVHRRWQYEAKDNNDADAYALARLGLEFNGPRSGWTKKAEELFTKCEAHL